MIVLLSPAAAGASDVTLGMVDAPSVQTSTAANVTAVWDRHFSAYASAGVTTVRAQTGWSDQQYSDGTWRNSTVLPYMREAIARGMRLSIDLQTIAAPPSWFIDANPDARLVDQNGLTTEYQMVSYWYPGLQAMIHAKTDQMLSMLASAGVLSHAATVSVSLGPADEPIYPPQWTIGDGIQTPGFWCYDEHAEADFTAKMEAKYGTIAKANAAWGTSYASFSALSVPKPGHTTVAEWTDVLSWYRTAKRAFIAWQIADTAAEIAKYAPSNPPRLSVPVAGDHISGTELAAATNSESSSDPSAVEMTDSEFVLDIAASNNADAHFTGMPDMVELQFIRGYIHGRGYDGSGGMLLTAENVGNASVSSDAAEFTTEALAIDLDGFDYLYGSALFASNGLTATIGLSTATTMDEQIAAGRDEARSTLKLGQNFALVQHDCVDIAGPAPAMQLCLSTSGVLGVVQSGTTLWQAASPSQSCPVSTAWNEGCFMLVQADGNLVLYNDQQAYWNTTTSGSNATTLRLSTSKPYLALLTSAGATVWDSTVGLH